MTSDDKKKSDQDSETAADDTVGKSGNEDQTAAPGDTLPGDTDERSADEAQVAGMEGAAVTVPDSADREDDAGDKEPAEDRDDEPDTESDERAAPPPPPAAGGSDSLARFLSVLAIIGVVAVYALTHFQQIPTGSAKRIAELENEVASLEGGPPVQSGDSTAALEKELADLGARVDELSGAVADAGSGNDAQASAAEGLRADLADLQARMDELSGLEERLSSIEARPDDAGTATTTPLSVTVGESEGGKETRERIAALDERLGDMKAEIAALQAKQESLSENVDSRLQAVRTDLTGALERETADVMDRLNQISEQAAAAGRAREGELARNAALVLAVGRLRDAAGTERAFTGAWESVTSLGVDGSAYPAVAEAAAEGVPTRASLRERFPDVASRAVVAATTGEDDSLIGGALRRVGNMVKVRRTGEVEGNSVEAVVARAEQRVVEDDLRSAVAELSALQGEAAEAVAPWKEDAERRIALEEGVDALQAEVFRNLSKDD